MISGMDMEVNKATDTCIRVHSQNITRENFVCNAETWCEPRLFNASVDWAAVGDFTPSWQCGVFRSTDFKESPGPQGIEEIFNHRIPFARKFGDGPPMVFVGFSHFQIYKGLALRTHATNVDHTGFNISIVKAHFEDDTLKETLKEDVPKIHAASVSWIAIPGMESVRNEVAWVGMLASNDPGTQSYAVDNESGWSGHVDFGIKFKRVPKIMVGVCHFNFGNERNIRLKVKTFNITETGMDWTICQWHDTILRSATVSYLAVDSAYE